MLFSARKVRMSALQKQYLASRLHHGSVYNVLMQVQESVKGDLLDGFCSLCLCFTEMLDKGLERWEGKIPDHTLKAVCEVSLHHTTP